MLAGDHPADTPLERGARASELDPQGFEVGHDELAGRRRRRGADVGGEVAKRGVLLVPDRRHDGHRTRGDGADDALVAERQQVVEAAARG